MGQIIAGKTPVVIQNINDGHVGRAGEWLVLISDTCVFPQLQSDDDRGGTPGFN